MKLEGSVVEDITQFLADFYSLCDNAEITDSLEIKIVS